MAQRLPYLHRELAEFCHTPELFLERVPRLLHKVLKNLTEESKARPINAHVFFRRALMKIENVMLSFHPRHHPFKRLKFIAGLLGAKCVADPKKFRNRGGIAYASLDGRDKVIYFDDNKDIPEARRYYSIAHELVHCMFDISGSRHGTADDLSNDLEILCENGASEILMPEAEFTQIAAKPPHEWSLDSLEELKEAFQCSTEAAIRRMLALYPGKAVGGKGRLIVPQPTAQGLAKRVLHIHNVHLSPHLTAATAKALVGKQLDLLDLQTKIARGRTLATWAALPRPSDLFGELEILPGAASKTDRVHGEVSHYWWRLGQHNPVNAPRKPVHSEGR